MKMRLLLVVVVFTNYLYSQNYPKLSFTYDLSGNQTSRIYCANCSTVSGKHTVNYANLTANDLEQFSTNDELSYYPNPVKEELFLKWKIKEGNTVNEIQLLTLNGTFIKEINNLSALDQCVISFSDVPQGMYLLNLLYADSRIESIKIVKN
ncbi:T9SS type A sorting domain-containing protein [Flavobacterium sp. SUN046]|uniref:T9SS type A sorting domain-containing protein n=1 Tax=Flavobacterium sp. SUN046 TaxID=3002440 RepID=UPI002DB5674F|nr:T9SS type A sorting domain-containing protein [Flavobacterium sp. SUN046]